MDSGQQLFSAGSRVGQYLVLEKLGEGGMSEVFKAIEPTLERYVAIKIMHRANLSSPEVMANFLEEARAIAGLRHTNIVPLYSAGEEQGVPYLAMGYIEGQTLEDWILAGRILNMEGCHVVHEAGRGGAGICGAVQHHPSRRQAGQLHGR